jgi:hypothetical protein
MKEAAREFIRAMVELKVAVHTNDFSAVASNIEILQSAGNRMESKLYDIKDFKDMDEQIKKRKTEIRSLSKGIEKLKFTKSLLTNKEQHSHTLDLLKEGGD